MEKVRQLFEQIVRSHGKEYSTWSEYINMERLELYAENSNLHKDPMERKPNVELFIREL